MSFNFFPIKFKLFQNYGYPLSLGHQTQFVLRARVFFPLFLKNNKVQFLIHNISMKMFIIYLLRQHFP